MNINFLRTFIYNEFQQLYQMLTTWKQVFDLHDVDKSKDLNEGDKVVTMLCDTGDRYLSLDF